MALLIRDVFIQLFRDIPRVLKEPNDLLEERVKQFAKSNLKCQDWYGLCACYINVYPEICDFVKDIKTKVKYTELHKTIIADKSEGYRYVYLAVMADFIHVPALIKLYPIGMRKGNKLLPSIKILELCSKARIPNIASRNINIFRNVNFTHQTGSIISNFKRLYYGKELYDHNNHHDAFDLLDLKHCDITTGDNIILYKIIVVYMLPKEFEFAIQLFLGETLYKHLRYDLSHLTLPPVLISLVDEYAHFRPFDEWLKQAANRKHKCNFVKFYKIRVKKIINT